jgi:hypothetical protein
VLVDENECKGWELEFIGDVVKGEGGKGHA